MGGGHTKGLGGKGEHTPFKGVVWGGVRCPTLDYFTRIFLRHGIDFDQLQAYEDTVSADGFYATIPDHYKNC